MSYLNLIKTLEECWGFLQDEYGELPPALITVGTGGRSANKLYGHFAPNSWQDENGDIHEVLIVAEQLKRPAKEIFTTVLHEAVHALNNSRGIKDVSGRSHNKKFVKTAEELGMLPPEHRDKYIGFSAVTLAPETEEKYAGMIAAINEAAVLSRKLKLKDKDTPKTSWAAVCECDRKIRVSKKLLDGDEPDVAKLQIVCSICGGEFKVEE